MFRALTALALLAALGGGAFWVLTRPAALPDSATTGLTGNAERGEGVFWAAGCAACHAAEGAQGDDKLILTGGQKFDSDFGTFRAPNISPHPLHGIGGWSVQDLANAMMRGVSPEGTHYYPAFPYTAYAKAEVQDVADLHAFLMTLPPAATPSQPHEVGFPFNIRRLVGGWKLLFATQDWHLTGDLSAEEARGRYLVEALGHCTECHTPRNLLGGLDKARWMAGAPNPSGRGDIPGLNPAHLDWSHDEIVEYLTSGFTPDFDSAGGKMVSVIEALAKLPEGDRQAIAAYLKRLPAAE